MMVFSKDRIEGRWKWGEHKFPKILFRHRF